MEEEVEVGEGEKGQGRRERTVARAFIFSSSLSPLESKLHEGRNFLLVTTPSSG